MKFHADLMLGKLTRWLRLAGQDVLYLGDFQVPPERQDEALIQKAKKDHRTILTRDLELHRRAIRQGIRSIYIESEDAAKQLAEISKHVEETIHINPENSRCPVCNGQLSRTGKETVEEKVPEGVLERQENFWECDKCGKIYWAGTHWNGIAEMAERYERLVE